MCQAEAPLWQKAWEKYGKKNVAVVGVNILEEGNATARAKKFRDQHKITFPVLVDAKSTLSQPYNLDGVPTVFIIDKQGKVAAVDPPDLAKRLEEMGAGQ